MQLKYAQFLIFQNMLPELAPVVVIVVVVAAITMLGCRGFVGPVPPPLWIRVVLFNCDETIASGFRSVKSISVKLFTTLAPVAN